MEPKKSLPIGVENFTTIRDGDYVYADKTKYLYNLLQDCYPYFLTRPRRFGKTLLISALEAILQGKRELFKGLWIDQSDYDWTPQPVIHLSLNEADSKSVDSINNSLTANIMSIAEKEKLNLIGFSPTDLFFSLFNDLSDKYEGKSVAILIDEYDAPVLNNIENKELSNAIIKDLRNFLGVLKGVHCRGFTFITGITSFVKMSLHPSLNSLYDLTFNKKYAGICGFTIEEFDALFPEHMSIMLDSLKSDNFLDPEADCSDLREIILKMYDGYSWDGKTRVLNPWDILMAFEKKDIGDFWRQSELNKGYIDNLIKSEKNTFRRLKNEFLNERILGEKLDTFPLLFQAGYLTVDHVDNTFCSNAYYLDFPNLEVKAAIIPLILSSELTASPFTIEEHARNMIAALIDYNFDLFQKYFESYLSCFSFGSHAPYEDYYLSLLLSAMDVAGKDIMREVSIDFERSDLHYKAPNGTHFVFKVKSCSLVKTKKKELSEDEILEKMQKEAEDAMKQIDDLNYTKPYKGLGSDIYKVVLVIYGHTRVLALVKKEVDN